MTLQFQFNPKKPGNQDFFNNSSFIQIQPHILQQVFLRLQVVQLNFLKHLKLKIVRTGPAEAGCPYGWNRTY